MIEVSHLSKTFHMKSGDVHAVDDVSLSVRDGEIFGVIGYSGGGKSTLVRCLNLLEVPDSGSVEALVLTSDDGSSFSGYRYSTWSDVQSGYEASSYVSWSREYVSVSPYIDGD